MRQERTGIAPIIEQLKSSDQARVADLLEQLYMSEEFRHRIVRPTRAQIGPDQTRHLQSVYIVYFDEISGTIRFMEFDFTATTQEEVKQELNLVNGIIESLPRQPFPNTRDPLARQLILSLLPHVEVVAGLESSKRENGERVIKVLWPRRFREALTVPESLKDDYGFALACMFLKMGNLSLEPPTSIILPRR